MAGPKDANIPSWQQGAARKDAAEPSTPEQLPATESQNESREALIEQAKRFLQDESIADAPTDKKVAFLETKGLSNDDIHAVLGISRNLEATTTTGQSTENTLSSSSNSTSYDNNTPASPSTQSSSQSTPPAATPSKDVPPIITYPEFLFRQPSPPLVTLQSFLYTLYGTAGLAASIYGASEFLAKPMLESLNHARHEFSETVQENLKSLNEALEQRVSVVPPTVSKSKLAAENNQEGQDEDDAASVTSDPTELFHRDIATQTIIEIDPSAPSETAVGAEAQTKPGAMAAIDGHIARLQSISSHLGSVAAAEKQSDSAHDSANSRLMELHTYLNSLSYNPPAFLSSTLYGSYDDSADVKKAKSYGREEEAIAAFKAEVRSVKGTLLSARNFPSGSGGTRAGTTVR